MWKHLSSLASSCSFFVFPFFSFTLVIFSLLLDRKIRHFLDSSRGGKRMTQSSEHCCPSGKKFQIFISSIIIVFMPRVCACTRALSHVLLFATSWAVAHQAPLSMGFFRQEYWHGLSFPPPGESSQPRNQNLILLLQFTQIFKQSSSKIFSWPLGSDGWSFPLGFILFGSC